LQCFFRLKIALNSLLSTQQATPNAYSSLPSPWSWPDNQFHKKRKTQGVLFYEEIKQWFWKEQREYMEMAKAVGNMPTPEKVEEL